MEYIHPGYLPELEEVHKKPTDYEFLGAKLPQEVLCEDGDWSLFLPKLEIQKNKYFDTYSCTNFANNNCSEAIHLKRYGEEIDYSERYSAVISGTIPNRGNSHVNVAESRRKKGSVLEVECPFTDEMTSSQYFSKVSDELLAKGLKWVESYEYGYEKIPSINDFQEALKYSPLQVAVDSHTNKRYNWNRADHSVMLYKWDKSKKKWLIFDSYLNRFQEYDVDYPFSSALRFHYKKIIKIKYEDMSLELIKGDAKPEVYLLDYEGIKHHIDSPESLEKLFSKKAWEKFITKPQAEVDAMPTGTSLTTKGISLVEALKVLIQTFGKKGKTK